MQDYSKPITTLPAYLSTISMVVDDRTAIVKSLTWAERKSPPKYMPARDLFCTALSGKFTFESALKQAANLSGDEKSCAIDVLKASKDFLVQEPRRRIGTFQSMQIELPNGLDLNISPVFLRHFERPRLMVLHFWKRPLLPRQLSAAGTALQRALIENRFDPSNYELDFISVSQLENAIQRQFRIYNWKTIKPLSDKELTRFWKLLVDAWSDYKQRPPRRIKRRNDDRLL